MKVHIIHFKLDPANFYTAPISAWQVEIAYTKIKLKLLPDQGILGGTVYRYAKANNKCMEDQNNPSAEKVI